MKEPSSIPQQVRDRIQKEADQRADSLGTSRHLRNQIRAIIVEVLESEYLRTQDQGWVSVKERLPELIGDRYDQKSSCTLLVYAAGIYFGQYRVPKDRRRNPFWVDPTDESILYVTDWRELPPPPQNE